MIPFSNILVIIGCLYSFFFNLFNSKLNTGVFHDYGLISSSTLMKTALDFARMDNQKYHTIFIDINVPKGTKVGFGLDWEQEVILPPNSRFKIVDKYFDKKNEGASIIYLDVILLD